MQQPTSRRHVIAAAAGAAAAIGVAGRTAAAEPSTAPSSTTTSAAVRARAASLLGRLSLEQKVGQLFVVEIYGQTADTEHAKNRELYGVSTPAQVIAKYRPGGVIYFDARRGPDNVREPRQIARLSNGLQRAALHGGARIPLLVSIDQEGGSVVYRMLEPATQLPGNMALAASRSAQDVYDSADIIGTELTAVGINQNYAPVADVNINPANPVIGVRSFGSDTRLCADFVSAAVRGYHHGGVASAGKHFPGHGDTDVDSHTGLPKITHTREELDRIDLPPFRAAIRRGVDTIMTAHIVVPSLDASLVPATMSQPIVTGLLREELGFQGVIATDALDMGGATGDFPPDVAPVRAFEAGCDQLVLAPKLDTAFAAVLSAVRSGKISQKRLDASVTRILEHKLRRRLFPSPYVNERRAARVVGSRRHRSQARAITERTVTLIRNESGALPLSGAPREVLVTGWGTAPLAALTRAINERRGQSATTLETGLAPDAAKIAEAVSAARDHEVTVVLANAAAAPTDKGAAQAKLIQALHATGTRLVVAAVRNPYDIQRYPDVPAYLATYSYGAPSMTALSEALYGDLNPGGRLPVAVAALDDPDRVLYRFGHGLRY
ncbi:MULTISPECIES: glycoside hydrolase family 3 protein [unclassified Streptomyces]|uniref:glycoside hydrolase family 3 protein n=1 Tax=unclassified Streptomyces TaxID=2593676 RepID=UPI002DDC2341|nr:MULTISPECIES: glycoside hydrolase family 3 protein [unclassified Streptomyces]WSA94163.1 glycoside hydrolase family 3 protein [Streptomyces sp. NBC_01795]WSB78582.1 glycoside hydrolase family 3 protein [Streptomyces sp. NBC_01775]WSS42012.1 glycoside hydrolase family 3 protein [Streptomyces sp. NBC_01187]